MKFHHFTAQIILAAFCLAVAGCGEDTSSKDDIPPQAPIPIPRSSDAVYPQRGIRPEPVQNAQSHWMRVEWQRSPETDVKGYRIWRGSIDPEEGSFYPVSELEYGIELSEASWITEHFLIDNGVDHLGNPSNLLAPVLGQSREYFWQIQAFDEAGNFSDWSDTIRYTLIENPDDLVVNRFGPDQYVIAWQYPTGGRLDYKIRVYSNHYGRDSVMWDPPVFPGYTTQETMQLNLDGTARPFVRDCTYVCQLNAIRDSESGAAVFTTFTYRD